MIFKNWFKPKWQHPDAVIRQQAIANLSSEQREHKVILHELAFNDSSETVRRCALEHLNDFALWWQASKQDNSDKQRQYAEQQLLNMLLQQQIAMPLKRQFIEQCNRTVLLEQLAERETDAEILFTVLQRLNKPELNISALTGKVLTISQKQQLLEQVDDQKQLEKLSKQLSGELAQQLEQKITEQAEQKLKPVKLRKDITLLLARLNALRERFTPEQIPAQLAELQTQWQQYQPDLSCLGDTEAATVSNKYQQLVSKLTSWLAPQLTKLAAEKAAAANVAKAEEQYSQFAADINQLSANLTEALSRVDISSGQQVAEQLSKVEQQISQATLLNDTQRARLEKQYSTIANQLASLPATAEKLTEASRLLSDWAAQALPDNPAELDAAKTKLNEYKQQWQQLTADLVLALPESIAVAKKQLQQQWQQVISELSNQNERALRQCRSKIAEFKKLDQQGRYKILFGLFKGIAGDYAELSPNEQQKLANDYEHASKRIAELADWQEYIATPRKQELLAQIQQMALTEPADVPARAEQIKQARIQWGSFGKAGPELEADLNADFDQACEQAYVPCRLYFAEQDKIKAANVVEREAIIAELDKIAAQQSTPAELDSGLKLITQRWQNAGPVKRQDFVELQQRYQQALGPLKTAVLEVQQHAAEQKQALVTEALAAVALTDSNQSGKILKELQQRWKQTGFAGKKHDQLLWQQFRKICDDFFSQRQQAFAQQQQQQLEQEQALSSQLADLEQAVQQLTAASSEQTITELAAQLQAMDVGVIATARKQRDKLQQQLLSLKQQQASEAAQQDIKRLFTLLELAENSTDNWPSQYKPQPELASALGLNRKGLTQALEIVSDVTGPAEERAERQQVQLTLLTLKHNAGEVTDKHSLLRHWLAFGPVTKAELSLVARLKPIFLTSSAN